MSTLSIRFATPADAGLIADLSRQTFYDSFAADNKQEDMDKFMHEQFSREKLMAEVTAPSAIFLLAMQGEEVVGYACMRESLNPPELGETPAIEIGRIYAVTHTIGKGVGTALMQQCLAIAREKKKAVVWLGVWENNQRAIDFYTKWGFRKFGQHIFVLGNDPQTDWLMKKEL
ncbi:GNAT family N-acetyltransferase [Pseudoflavitalea sp. X16]|uniref:GNAT family N-acetyltransferase n=1 Tax=Paraflavitalea devenefica TaxID=2716334 RepID=UPI001421ABF0|nr:GNAT family N-acetyltransferase [Paraflavitalea devenefica]NII28724.1 GNAT family N-acetyltransferase [Paraflavitalea devenefica]